MPTRSLFPDLDPRDKDPVDTVEVECERLRETDLAILVRVEISGRGASQIWLPKSLAQWHEDLGVVEIAEWKALDEGLI